MASSVRSSVLGVIVLATCMLAVQVMAGSPQQDKKHQRQRNLGETDEWSQQEQRSCPCVNAGKQRGGELGGSDKWKKPSQERKSREQLFTCCQGQDEEVSVTRGSKKSRGKLDARYQRVQDDEPITSRHGSRYQRVQDDEEEVSVTRGSKKTRGTSKLDARYQRVQDDEPSTLRHGSRYQRSQDFEEEQQAPLEQRRRDEKPRKGQRDEAWERPVESKRSSRKQARDESQQLYETEDYELNEDEPISSEFPQCERYSQDEYKLAKCERKARTQSALNSDVSECQHLLHDAKKLAKCEKGFRELSLPQSLYPECQKYAYDPYKLSVCESKASEIAAAQVPIAADLDFNKQKSTPPVVKQQQYMYPQCMRYAQDPYKMAKCEGTYY